MRLDRYLRKRLFRVPLSHVYKLMRTGGVRVGGVSCRAGKRLLAVGERVEATIPKADAKDRPPGGFSPDLVNRPFFRESFRILYQDASIMALDKPVGLPVHPGGDWDRKRLTLIDMAKTYLAAKRLPDGSLFEPALVHRLDQQTSGVILVAKTGEALRKMADIFRAGTIEKEYLALVRGIPAEPQGRVDLSLIKKTDPRTGKKLVRVTRGRGPEGAEAAETLWAVERTWRCASLLAVRILTGKMHQIRVHLSAVGHPLAGDARYGDFAFNRMLAERTGLRRLFLHARRVAFTHPVTERPVEILAPLPDELAQVLNRLTDKRL